MNDSACSHHVSPAGEDEEDSATEAEEAVQFENFTFRLSGLSQESAMFCLLDVAELRRVTFVARPLFF